jgi:hypothetical protein
MIGLYFAAAIVIGVALGVALSDTAQPDSTSMKPNNLDGFSPTRCQEGTVIPVTFGRIRLTGNLLWYGNLKTEPIIQVTSVPRPFRSDKKVKTITGYKYYLDMWQGVCQGNVDLVQIYNNDKLFMIGHHTFNGGNLGFAPPVPVEGVGRCDGVAHVWFPAHYLGENNMTPPTFHFVVDRVLDSPLTHAVMANGVNPAAIIYELLIHGGAAVSMIDMDSFQKAADYWYTKGYGLNINFSEIKEIRECITTVFQYVDGVLVDHGNRFELVAYTPEDEAVDHLTKDDFIDFTFSRKSWEDTYNDLRGNYIDEDQAFTQRTVAVVNPANIAVQGRTNQKTVDLSAYRDRETASKRLWELMKRLSYPEASVSFRTHVRHGALQVGNIIVIDHDEYGLVETYWRITEKDLGEVDVNEVTFRAVEAVERLFDSRFAVSGVSEYSAETAVPSPPLAQALFELPWNMTGHVPAWLMLVARAGNETSFRIMTSSTGTDYSLLGECGTFAQHGVLLEAYGSNTLSLDDDTGILYAPEREDPVFPSLSRSDLFAVTRVAIIGSEILGFQTVTPEGGTGIRLKGCIRGLYNTPISDHPAGSGIWIANIGDNVSQGIGPGTFVKFIPCTQTEAADLAEAVAVQAVSSPVLWAPARIRAVRSGSQVNVTWWPKDDEPQGAGAVSPDSQADQDPFLYSGDFQVTHPGGTVTVTGCTLTVSFTGSGTIEVRARYNGRMSAAKSLTVGAADGETIS